MKLLFGILIFTVATACTGEKKPQSSPEPKAETPPPLPAWPEQGSRLTLGQAAWPEGFGKRRVFIDPGHGSPGNSGNTSSLCIDEQDHNLRVSNFLASCLEKTGHFETLLSRKDRQLVKYRRRLKAAKSFRADVYLSIHSDARGAVGSWAPKPGLSCPHNLEEPGFSILWSDQGDEGLVDKRLALARAVASQMSATGFLAFNGVAYEELYTQDSQVPGVFVDRHQPRHRILVLHGASMPSVIIETHHAWDAREERRWQEEHTLSAFCQTVSAALAEVLSERK